MDADEIMMLALDAGAEDFSEEEDSYEILTAPDDFSAVREALEKAGLPIAEAQVAMIPQTMWSLQMSRHSRIFRELWIFWMMTMMSQITGQTGMSSEIPQVY